MTNQDESSKTLYIKSARFLRFAMKESKKDILVHAIKGGLRTYLITYSLKGGLAFLLRLIRVSSGKY